MPGSGTDKTKAWIVQPGPIVVLVEPQLTAVCFRHLLHQGASEQTRNRFNLALLKRIVARGRVYLSNAELKGKFCLRACIMNHLTRDADIDAVVLEVLEVAPDLIAELAI